MQQNVDISTIFPDSHEDNLPVVAIALNESANPDSTTHQINQKKVAHYASQLGHSAFLCDTTVLAVSCVVGSMTAGVPFAAAGPIAIALCEKSIKLYCAAKQYRQEHPEATISETAIHFVEDGRIPKVITGLTFGACGLSAAFTVAAQVGIGMGAKKHMARTEKKIKVTKQPQNNNSAISEEVETSNERLQTQTGIFATIKRVASTCWEQASDACPELFEEVTGISELFVSLAEDSVEYAKTRVSHLLSGTVSDTKIATSPITGRTV